LTIRNSFLLLTVLIIASFIISREYLRLRAQNEQTHFDASSPASTQDITALIVPCKIANYHFSHAELSSMTRLRAREALNSCTTIVAEKNITESLKVEAEMKQSAITQLIQITAEEKR
jgi:hypothetical protein